MGLVDLLQKYAGKADNQTISMPNAEPTQPSASLPSDINQWPAEWRHKLRDNIRTLQDAFDMEEDEAMSAAEPAVRYEYDKQHAAPSGGDRVPLPNHRERGLR